MLIKENYLEDLKKYLHQKTNYSYNNLKKKLEITNDDDFFYLLCNLLKETIDNFNFETPVYYNKFLFKCTNYLNENDIEINNKKYFVDLLNDVKETINKKINKNRSYTTVSSSNKAFLLSLFSEINCSITKIKDEKEEIDNNSKEAYLLLKELIFDVRNPIYIEEILENYPNLILLREGNRYLYEDVYDKFLNVLLNRNDDYELLYFNKLINIFLNNSNDNEDIKYITLNKAGKLLTSLDNRDLSKEKKERITFFLKDITNNCNHEKENNGVKLQKLKIKYNLNKIAELQKYKIVRPNWKQYRESNKYILTFDDPNARIFEQAISLDISNDGKIYLRYYVCDVDSYLKENKELENNVYDNALSIKGFPMLPKELRERISLKEGKRRNVIAYLFELDSYLNVVSFKVERQNIRVKYNLKFSDVKKIINYPIDTKLKRVVSNMFTLSKYIYQNREIKNEYHDIKEISKKIFYNDEYTEKNRGSKMMSDYQIFLNSYLSEYCYDRDLPYLYRNNEFNRSVELIEELKEKYENQMDLKDILSFIYAIYEPSNYSTINKGHAGLNLVAYGEVSKPARSYASIINQRIINNYLVDGMTLDEDQKRKLINELNKVCKHLNEKRILYDNYTYEYNKILKKKKNNLQ